jgi:hypothetical protein
MSHKITPQSNETAHKSYTHNKGQTTQNEYKQSQLHLQYPEQTN